MPNPRWTHDRKLAKEQLGIVGVDEAGRGCLAGPVVAGAVIIPGAFFSRAKNRKLTEEINDSKQFNEDKREQLYEQVLALAEEQKIFAETGQSSVEEIEEHNIVGATCLAMKRALDKHLRRVVDFGNRRRNHRLNYLKIKREIKKNGQFWWTGDP